MRTFKFRAWDECNGIMHLDFQFIKSGGGGNDWILFVSDKQTIKSKWKENPFFSQQFKIMQFTGLLDKSGKEIFESDIVKRLINHNSSAYMGKKPKCFSESIEIVTFFEGEFISYKPKKNPQPLKNYSREELHSLRLYDIEVIGNIYEHPHLLEDAHD